MKKILLIIAALFVVNSAFSQEAKWGIKAGGNLSIMSENQYLDRFRELLSFHAGVFANVSCKDFINFSWSNIINFQPELLFSVQGGKHESIINNTIWQNLVFKFSYVQIPLLFEIKPIDNLGILVGPQLGLNVSRKVTVTSSSNANKESVTISGSDFDKEFYKLKKLDIAMVLGLQYTIKRVTIGARYNLGLTYGYDYTTYYGSSYAYNEQGWRTNVIQAGFGFSF